MEKNTENTVPKTAPVKPTLVAREEFAERLVELINTSGLPLAMVEPILNNACATVRATVQQQYEQDRARYEQEMEAYRQSETDKEA